MNDKLYLFNPFNIKNISEQELQKMYQEVFSKLNENPNTMWEYSHDIEVYSNLTFICGEVIARLTKDILELKTEIEIAKAEKTVDERQGWNQDWGKMPAIAYFEALATKFCKEEISKLADKECSLKRFKNAYDSLEEKINALKRKCESIKFEEFNK